MPSHNIGPILDTTFQLAKINIGAILTPLLPITY